MSCYEQYANIKFCVLFRKSPSNTLQMLNEEYGSESIKISEGFKCSKRFSQSRTSVENDPHSGGRPQVLLNVDN